MYPRSSREKKSAIFPIFQRRTPRSTLKNQKNPHKLRHLLEHLDVEANAGLSRMGFWYRTIQSNNNKRPSIIYFVVVVGVDAVVVGVAASPDIIKEASNSSNRLAMSSTVAVQKQGHQLEYC